MTIDDLTKTVSELPVIVPVVGGFYAGIVANVIKNYDLYYNYAANYLSPYSKSHLDMFVSSMEAGAAGVITGLVVFGASKLYQKLKK